MNKMSLKDAMENKDLESFITQEEARLKRGLEDGTTRDVSENKFLGVLKRFIRPRPKEDRT